MRIEQGEVVIRSATVDDAAQLNSWWNDGEVMAHAGFPNGLGESLDDTICNILQWEGKLSQLCLIEIQGKPAGELSYRVKDDGTAWPGWKICVSDYQNQGYGTKRLTPPVVPRVFIQALVLIRAPLIFKYFPEYACIFLGAHQPATGLAVKLRRFVNIALVHFVKCFNNT